MRARTGLGAALLTVLALTGSLTLTGCGGSDPAAIADAPGDGSGFVAGDGSIVLLDAQSRMPAPDLAGTTLDGEPFRLADHLGDVVVLNVWASWCAPCRAEAPVLEQAAQDFADQPVQFVGIDTRDQDAAAKAFVERFGITFPSVVDRDGRLQLLFADTLPPQAIPSTLVIDQQGRVAARALGAVTLSDIRGMVEPLLAEGAAGS